MRWATVVSFSMHTLGALGVYSLYPHRGVEQDLSAVMRVEFVPYASKIEKAPVQKKHSASDAKKVSDRSKKERIMIGGGNTSSSAISSENARVCRANFSPSPYNRHPEYPEIARAKNIEGVGMFRLFLLPNGSVEKIEKISGNMHVMLIESAKHALMSWSFRGNIPPFVDVPIEFKLSEM